MWLMCVRVRVRVRAVERFYQSFNEALGRGWAKPEDANAAVVATLRFPHFFCTFNPHPSRLPFTHPSTSMLCYIRDRESDMHVVWCMCV